jgi:hypothetical protein
MDITEAFASRDFNTPAIITAQAICMEDENAVNKSFGWDADEPYSFDSFVAERAPVDDDDDVDEQTLLHPAWRALFISCLSSDSSQDVRDTLCTDAEPPVWDPTAGMSYRTRSTESTCRVREALSGDLPAWEEYGRPNCEPRMCYTPTSSTYSTSEFDIDSVSHLSSEGPITPETYPIIDITTVPHLDVAAGRCGLEVLLLSAYKKKTGVQDVVHSLTVTVDSH